MVRDETLCKTSTSKLTSLKQVTPAENIELMSYILEKFLLRPKIGSQKYEQLMEIYLESSSFFKEIMRYECFCNLDANEVGFTRRLSSTTWR
jgi:hypothetical protein